MPGSKQQRLSRDRILRAALETVDEEGFDALSMRRLARRLDVWPMSIYRYFRDKDELLDALADSAAVGLEVPSVRASWRNQMKSLLREARRVLGSDLASRLPRAMVSPGLLRMSEAGLAILEQAGFDKRQAATAWRALLSYTFGFSTTSMTGDAARRTRAAIAALPEDDFPSLHAAADELAAVLAADDEFDHGLDSLLDGIEASLGSTPGSPSRA
jgi:AcrR family transcriptional regulator